MTGGETTVQRHFFSCSQYSFLRTPINDPTFCFVLKLEIIMVLDKFTFFFCLLSTFLFVESKEVLMEKIMEKKMEALAKADIRKASEKAENFQKFTRKKGEVVCDNEKGIAAEGVFDFECKNMNLVSILSGPELGSGIFGPRILSEPTNTWINDIWGWVDPLTKREFAIVGLWDGTSFVDVTNPRNPKVLGFLEGTFVSSQSRRGIFRDIKVVDNTAYIGSEMRGHGVQVFDLTSLRTLRRGTPVNVTRLVPDNTLYEVGQTHNIVAAPEAGKVIAVGMDFREDPSAHACFNGSLAIWDVSSNPLQPVFETCFFDEDILYVHDAHCVKYAGPDTSYTGVNICALFAETDIYLFNLDKLEVISKFTYESRAYVHQGWFSEDHSYLYTNDERDEVFGTVSDTTTYIFNVTDLSNPVKVDTFVHNQDTDFIHDNVDHNLYIKGDYVYQASYTAGARIREIQGDRSLREVAYFDMEQNCETIDDTCSPFYGAWTVFPYYDSGIVTCGSILEGFFILRPTL